MAVNKYAFANILNHSGEDVTFTDSNGNKHTIPKQTTTFTVSGTFETDQDAWKADSSSTDTAYITKKYRKDGTLRSTNVAAVRQGYIYLVSAPVNAVARIIENRKDVITKADLIRAAKYNDGYVYFTY